MEYTPNHRFLDEYRRSSPDLRRVLETKLDAAEAYYESRARKLTGKMAERARSAVIDGPHGMEGLFEVPVYYAPFQEFGTQDIEGQHILPEIMTLLEDGDL